MITTLPPDRLDEARPLQTALHRHHAALAIPSGFVARDESLAWQGWRDRAARLVQAGRGELFVSTDAHGIGGLDGLALVRLISAADATRLVLEATGDHAELVTLVVADDARGSGAGGALYERCVEWARARSAVALQIGIRAVNTDALRFYERHGAQPAFSELVQPL